MSLWRRFRHTRPEISAKARFHLKHVVGSLTPTTAVVVRFKAVGNAPIMKQNFYKITASNRFQAVVQFLRKELAWKASDPLVSHYYTHSDVGYTKQRDF